MIKARWLRILLENCCEENSPPRAKSLFAVVAPPFPLHSPALPHSLSLISHTLPRPPSLSCQSRLFPLQTILMSNNINLHVSLSPHLSPRLLLAMQSNCALGRFNCYGLDLCYDSRYINPALPPLSHQARPLGLPIDPVTAFPALYTLDAQHGWVWCSS